MTREQFDLISHAYRDSKAVLDQIEDSANKSTVFKLSAAVGALESLCLSEMGAGMQKLTDKEKADFVAHAIL